MKNIIQKINWYARLIRLPNLIIIAVSQYFVRYNMILPVLKSKSCTLQTGHLDFALLVLSTLLIAAAGYIINDYFDIRIDVVNRPDKVILQKHVPLRRAIWLHYALTIPGCLLGIYVAFKVGSFNLGFIQIIVGIALWYYSLKYKRIPFAGNFTVAILASVSIAVIWLFEFFAIKHNPLTFADMIGYFGLINRFVLGYAVFAFLVSLLREMIKDIEDIEGDKSFRCRTLPIVYGIPFMRKVIFIITGFIIALTVLSTVKLFQWGFILIAWYFAIVMGLLWLYFVMQLNKAREKKDYHFLSNILKIMIIAGVLSMQLLYIRL